MSTIAFRSDEDLKRQLQHLAKTKGINLSALIKLYLTQSIKKDLTQITENGMTVAEELELLMMKEEGGDGVVHNGAAAYTDYLKQLDE